MAIFESVYQKIKLAAEQKGKTLQDYVNETLLMNVERDEFLKIFAPNLSLEYVANNTIFLHDEKQNKTITIKLRYHEDSSCDDGFEIFCEQDESIECLHVRFTMALPELIKLNLKRSKQRLEGWKNYTEMNTRPSGQI
ncbi:hypothetical protein [Candidatus Nitrosocosmicus sp. SS]|uniref:hypothetical protein n=1 Tax=Candidatus Nitrosocosmicus agrestis TaxID=2563600 RepID=UPI001250F535|nr:hypothetical protein [Candidatus Nitrosocosmicus sp. SS]KAA2281224.1 hypothetical protein F1Z66_08885 [Candidatus Nitrosocosmicus sp. SS]KAF0868361.1 hypothetical protein E5N71_10420 [Candidatus Nitrosocosmicus sp. SS]